MTAQLGLVLLVLLVPIAVADWIVVGILSGAAHHDGPLLRERRDLAAVLALVSTLYFAVGINTVLGFPWFPLEVAVIFNRGLFLLIGVIPLRFLWALWTGKFD